MDSLPEEMYEYQKQLAKGSIQKAYQGLMTFMMGLRIHLSKEYPDYSVSGSLYPGYMDMTYFSISPKQLMEKDLKIAVVFLHETCRFEVWLSGRNKKVLTEYWEILKEKDWGDYKIVQPGKGIDSILEYIVVEKPDFGNLEALTKQIEKGTVQFIQDVEDFLSTI